MAANFTARPRSQLKLFGDVADVHHVVKQRMVRAVGAGLAPY